MAMAMASFSTLVLTPRPNLETPQTGGLRGAGPVAEKFYRQRVPISACSRGALGSPQFRAHHASSVAISHAGAQDNRPYALPVSTARSAIQASATLKLHTDSLLSRGAFSGASIGTSLPSKWKREILSGQPERDSLIHQRSALSDQQTETPTESDVAGEQALVGEDAGLFDVTEQKTSSWTYFTIVLGVVLAILYVVWLDPNTGFGGAFIKALYSINSNHEAVMLEILCIFALVHSGGASIRATGEKLIGERAYRVVFAGLSLPLAVSAVVYFINHRYDGTQLWQLRTVPGVHELCWVLSFVSFFFLYPSTFNLLEVAAVDKPKLHMYETGIMRITRHPQMAGQLIWCLAHTVWIGNSFTLTTSLGLMAHHLFGVWHGDRRLAAKYGEAFEIVKKRTSVVPFVAILEGRQVLPEDYYREFLRLPYFVILGLTLGAYFSHPLMQYGSFVLHW